MYASIDVVVDKIERQIRSGKEVTRKRGAPSAGEFAAATAVGQKADTKE
jgi:ribosome-associated translation inhibitor RaiA